MKNDTSSLTSDERRTYQSLRDRGYRHDDAMSDALDGVHVDDVRTAHKICDGCNVREPFEHRCHGLPCTCKECREADRLFGS